MLIITFLTIVGCKRGTHRQGQLTNTQISVSTGQNAVFDATNGVRACAVKFKVGSEYKKKIKDWKHKNVN